MSFKPYSDIPAQLSPAKKRFLRMYAASPGFLADAARKAGVPRRTLYNWLKDDPLFAETFQNAGDHFEDFVKGKLIEKIEKGNLAAIKLFLKTYAKDRGYG